MNKGTHQQLVIFLLSLVFLAACEPDPQTEEQKKSVVDSQIENAITHFENKEFSSSEAILDQIDVRELGSEALHTVASSYLAIGQPQKTIDTLASSLSRESKPQTMVVAGLAYEATDKKFLAEHWLNLAAQTAETDGLIQLAYVDWLIRYQRNAEANAYLTSKVETYPGFSPFLDRFVRTGIQSDKAISAANILLGVQDKNPEAPWMLSILYNNLEMWPEALVAVEKAISSNPDNERQRQGLAQILSNIVNQTSANADWAQAEKAADLLLQIDHSRVDWLEARLRIALSQRDYSTATALVKSWDHLNAPQQSQFFGDIALAKGNLEVANGRYLDAWNVQPSMTLASRLTHVRKSLGYNDSLSYIKQWSEKDSSNSQAFLALAMIEEAAGKIEPAIEAYHSSIEISPNQWVAHNNLAWLYSKQGSGEKALSHAQQAVEAKPDVGEVLDTLAWMHHLHGQPEEAKKWAQRAVELAPGSAEVKSHFEIIHGQ